MPRNPLADYIDRPAPYFDYTDAHTWYDGLWGGGQWPPEGIRGIGQFTPGFPPGFDPPVYFHTPVFFPGDRARIMAGLRGLGASAAMQAYQSGQTVVDLSSSSGTVDLTYCDQATIDAYNSGLIPAPICAAPTTTNTDSTVPCLSGQGPLRPGQSYCPPPTSTGWWASLTSQQQGTIIMGGAAAGLLLLMLLMRRR